MVELGTLKLALKGSGCTGVRLRDVAVIASWCRSAQGFWGCCISAIDRGFVGKAPRGQVTARCGFIPTGRPKSCQLRFRIG